MAFPVQPTLQDVVDEVLTLVAEGGEGVASVQAQEMASAFVRRAQAMLYQKAAWTINRLRIDKTLAGSTATGTQTMDWPDEVWVGHITRITATRDSDPRYEWTLDQGIAPDDRSTWNFGGFSTNTFTPYKWDIRNQLIELGPINQGDVTLHIEGDAAPTPLLNPGEYLSVDADAATQLAAIMLCNRLGGEYRSSIPLMQSEYSDYLESIKPKQGNGEPVVPGSIWAVDDPARLSNWKTSRQRHWMYRDRRP